MFMYRISLDLFKFTHEIDDLNFDELISFLEKRF